MACRVPSAPEDLVPSCEYEPTDKDLNNIVNKVTAKYRSVLLHLGVTANTIKTLEIKHHEDPARILFEGLIQWRNEKPRSSHCLWEDLLKAIEEGAENGMYAEEWRTELRGRSGVETCKQRPKMEDCGSGMTPVYLPVINDLKTAFSTLAANVCSVIFYLREDLRPFHTFLRNYLKPSHVSNAKPPIVPETVEELEPFLINRWDPLQIDLLKATVEHLAVRKNESHDFYKKIGHVQSELEDYEKQLKDKLHKFLSQYDWKHVNRKTNPACSAVSVKISLSPSEITLARIMELKGFFIYGLGIPSTLFTGFSEGSTVVFFSIPTESVGRLHSCLETSNMSLLKEWNIVIFSVEGCFTVDIKKSRILYYLQKAIDPSKKNRLYLQMSQFIEATKNVVQHRDIGKNYLNESADNLDSAFKKATAAKIVGSGMSLSGGVLGIVGGGLLLGGVTAPVGIALLVAAGVVGVAGGVTGVGATIGDSVKNHKTLKNTNNWMARGRELCQEMMTKREAFLTRLRAISQEYEIDEEEALKQALAGMREGDAQFTLEDFTAANGQVDIVVKEWKAALQVGGEAVATGVAAGVQVGGAVARGAVIGAEAGVEATTAVARTVVAGVGGVVIGLSAVFVVVDLALLAKTGYDIHKNKGGTKLAKTLREAELAVRDETEQLRALANLFERN